MVVRKPYGEVKILPLTGVEVMCMFKDFLHLEFKPHSIYKECKLHTMDTFSEVL